MKRRHDVRSINFGETGNPSRVLINAYVQRNGRKALSALVRKLVFVYLSEKGEFTGWKKDMLIYEWKENSKKISAMANRKREIADQLKMLGINTDDLL